MSWKHFTLLCITVLVTYDGSYASKHSVTILDTNVDKSRASSKAIASDERSSEENRDGLAVVSVYNERNGVGSGMNAVIPLRSSYVTPLAPNLYSPLPTSGLNRFGGITPLGGFQGFNNINELNRYNERRSLGGFPTLGNLNGNLSPVSWNTNAWPDLSVARTNPNMGQFQPQLDLSDMDNLLRSTGQPNQYGRLESPNPPIQFLPDPDAGRKRFFSVSDFFSKKPKLRTESSEIEPWNPSYFANDYAERRANIPPPIPNLKPGQAVYRKAEYQPEEAFANYQSFDGQPLNEVRDLPYNTYAAGYQAFDSPVQSYKRSSETDTPDYERASQYVPLRRQFDEANNAMALNALQGNVGRINDNMYGGQNELFVRSSASPYQDPIQVPQKGQVRETDKGLDAWFPIVRANEFLRSGASSDDSGLRRVDRQEALAIKSTYSTGTNTNTLPKKLN